MSEIERRGEQDGSSWQGKALIPGSEDQCRSEVAARGDATDDYLSGMVILQEKPIGSQAVIHCCWEWMVWRHPVVDGRAS